MPSSLICPTSELNQQINDFFLPFSIRWNKNLHRWEKEKSKRKRITYYKVALFFPILTWFPMCLSIVVINVNHPGIFQARQTLKDIKVNYFAKAVDYITNVLMISKEIVLIKNRNSLSLRFQDCYLTYVRNTKYFTKIRLSNKLNINIL